MNNLVRGIQSHPDFTCIGIERKSLRLSEGDWAEDGGEREYSERFHCVSRWKMLTTQNESLTELLAGLFQPAYACAAGCVTRVSFAVTRMAPGHIRRQNGSTARAMALFIPLAASSARRICGNMAVRSFA